MKEVKEEEDEGKIEVEEGQVEQVPHEEPEEERSGHALIITSNNYNATLLVNSCNISLSTLPPL